MAYLIEMIDQIFNGKSFLPFWTIFKINHLFLLWVSVAPNAIRVNSQIELPLSSKVASSLDHVPPIIRRLRLSLASTKSYPHPNSATMDK